ncbi:ArsA family ATPase [Acetobacterium sp.]|uniref:ArsA family ATPase n=1 Tax=Acetobacterium sp. TaxID=1872094 RepID=UPI002F3FDE04
MTGKGGVGKTSVAAAHALKSSKEGKKTLIVSTDMAHNLGDLFNIPIGKVEVEVADNLFALEIDPNYVMEKDFKNMMKAFGNMISSLNPENTEIKEFTMIPGMDELFSLLRIQELYNNSDYDRIIVDCTPTGETLSLLKFPEMFGNLIKTVLPMKRKAVKVAGPMVERIMKIPMPEENVFDDIELLNEKLYKLQSIMTNKEILSIRIVTTPERIVIKEAKRNFTYLHLYNYNIDAIIVNKVYPKQALEGYFSKWINLQEEGLKEIQASFSKIPVFTLMLQSKELVSEKLLLDAALQIFKDTDPAAVLFRDKIFEVKKISDGYCFILNIPFANKADMVMGQKGNELMIQIKNEKRCFTLPDVLKNKTVQSAKYTDGQLSIKFA